MMINYVQGDATSPQSAAGEIALIVHVSNDRGGWGRGFVLAVSHRWPQPQAAYRNWSRTGSNEQAEAFELGNIQYVRVEPSLYVVNMIAQAGYGKNNARRGVGRSEKEPLVNLNTLLQVTDIVCHDNCSDGTVSAILLHDALPNARIRFCQYGISHEKLEVKPNMLFCDFSPHESRYQEFAAAGAMILDHHKSARHIVDSFGERGVFGDEATEPGVSGAVLAFRHVWLPMTGLRFKHDDEVRHAADIARLIGIRDTWQKHDPDWLAACELGETIRFFSQDSWLIQDPFAMDRQAWWSARRSVGQRLVEKQHVTLRKVLEGAYRFTSPVGTRVVMFSGTKLTSDACEAVKQEADLIVGFDYFAIEDGQASLGYSLRSYASSRFECSTFCKTLGGGGHTKAAGFSVRFDPALGTGDPFSVFQARLREYEAAAGI